MKIYVDNLKYDVSEEFVRSLFSRHGAVQEIWLVRTRLGSPRGYGFVHMEDASAGATAIAKLDGIELDGRPITVSRARD